MMFEKLKCKLIHRWIGNMKSMDVEIEIVASEDGVRGMSKYFVPHEGNKQLKIIIETMNGYTETITGIVTSVKIK